MIRAAASLTGLIVVLALVLYLTLADGNSSPSTTSPSPIVAASPLATQTAEPTLTPAPLLIGDTPSHHSASVRR